MTKLRFPQGLPTRQQVLDFIAQSDEPAGKREMAKAFGLKGTEKIALKALLKDMADEGLIDGNRSAFHAMGGVPKVTVLRIVEIDEGEPIAVPDSWQPDDASPPPRIRVIEPRGKVRDRTAALRTGDRVLARTEEAGKGWIAHPMKKLQGGEEQMMGVVELDATGKGWLAPVDKRVRNAVPISDLGGAEKGQLVLAEPNGRSPRAGMKVVAVLGDPLAPRAFSLIAIHKHGIPFVFPEGAVTQAELAAKLPLSEDTREDLRHLPIVAIDPADARDHDDAIWAEPDGEGGFKALVAIADVSFYVRPGSETDREARKRGNSVYFPDRVVPMLPEVLSADVCSLKSGADRAAMACHLTIDSSGHIKNWRFTRAIVRIAEVIAYEEAQRRIDETGGHHSPTPSSEEEGEQKIKAPSSSEERGHPSIAPSSLEEGVGGGGGAVNISVLQNLWSAWKLLEKARHARDPLNLDLPERRVVLNSEGKIAEIAIRERLDAHRVVEDFMIAANVAAAKALEAKVAPVVYRIHEPPSREKLTALKDYLATFDKKLSLGQVITPSLFNRMLKDIADEAEKALIMEAVLRSQTQAYYGPRNAGHFGLALGSYAHFTSPIRRYSDLLVHRALVDAYGLEQPRPKADLPATSGLSDRDRADLARVSEALSNAERRAMEAERDTIDRYVAAWLSGKVGEVFDTRVTGVQKFGLFATIIGLGGDGLVPISTLGAERFNYDEKAQRLIGELSGEEFVMGQILKLRLAEANPLTGALKFEPVDVAEGVQRIERRGGARTDHKARRQGQFTAGKRGRPSNIRHQGRKK
ncbi:MAG: ribonuclease R [Novosphingobium sp. 28-62-57]|uniref:ribonuclease R family protein n=1 Tax=Novosphingobium sp. 28-62-57 TaxID=1970409 RepID=UPI000BC86AD6|nr:RNB domain-containing ribonuclease [Novosphingobium sp. 28-62-57]OYW49572.1 MAG: ribonuclease R [Novosphingobium sp. 12-62-10]OYZ12472.1 MAG: ribonuclease R [Novosphingobium sp. 28-62-57]HQS70570.1 RNB domain-containing ribonuclease [Novosphingobium sp.]